MRHAGFDLLDDVEDGVHAGLRLGGFHQARCGGVAQCWLEILIRSRYESEPEAPWLVVGLRQSAAVDLTKNLLDRVRIVFLERDHILLGLLSDTLSAFMHTHRGEDATRAHLEGAGSSTQLAEILILLADDEFVHFYLAPVAQLECEIAVLGVVVPA